MSELSILLRLSILQGELLQISRDTDDPYLQSLAQYVAQMLQRAASDGD